MEPKIQLFKNIHNRDVAFEILEMWPDPDKKFYNLTVCWWNIGRSHAPFCMNIEQKLQIPVDKFKSDYYIMPQWQYSGHEYPLKGI